MPSKKKPEEKEFEYTYQDLVTAFLVLRVFEDERLPIKAALRVRRIHRALKAEVLIFEELRDKIFSDNGAEKAEDGWSLDDEGEVIFATKKGKTRGEKDIEELKRQETKVKFVPLEESDIELARGLDVSSNILIALEDSRILKAD